MVIAPVLWVNVPLAHADVDPPDEDLELVDIRAYRSVIEDNDQFYLISYDLGYTTNPTGYNASELFVIRLLDGSTELVSATPYPYYEDGFIYGVVGFYFTAAEVAGLGMGFGDATDYTVQITGNPTVPWVDGSIPIISTTTFDQWYLGTQSQNMLTIRMRQVAVQVENAWVQVYDLLEGNAGEQVLSYDGETYFTNTIPDLLALCPDLFASTRDLPTLAPKKVVTDSHIAGDDDTYFPVYSGTWAYQSFTARQAYTITTCELELSRVGTPTSDLIISVTDMTGNHPDLTPILISGTIPREEIGTYVLGEWVTVSFEDGTPLEFNTRYGLVAHTASGSTTAQYRWRGKTEGDYSGGLSGFSIDNGVNWTTSTNDLNFIIGAEDAESMSFNQKQAHILDGTVWDLSDLGESIDISVMWLRALIWFIFTIVTCVAMAQGTKSTKPILFTFLIMIAIGAPFGFIYWYFAAFALFFCAVIAIFSLTWEKSST